MTFLHIWTYKYSWLAWINNQSNNTQKSSAVKCTGTEKPKEKFKRRHNPKFQAKLQTPIFRKTGRYPNFLGKNLQTCQVEHILKRTVPPWKKLSNKYTRIVCQNVEEVLLNIFVIFLSKHIAHCARYWGLKLINLSLWRHFCCAFHSTVLVLYNFFSRYLLKNYNCN